MIPMTRLKKIAGLICGSVTCQNRRHAPAPSISAASWRCSGTFCNAAKKISMAPPAPQRFISSMAGLHHVGEYNQPGTGHVPACEKPRAANRP